MYAIPSYKSAKGKCDFVLTMERQRRSGIEALDYIYDECCENCPQVLDLLLHDAWSVEMIMFTSVAVSHKWMSYLATLISPSMRD